MTISQGTSIARSAFIAAGGLGMAMLVALAGCGSDSVATDSQVAARINKGEVSVHQVQAVLQRQPRLVAEQQDAAGAKVLEVLIEQELAAQAAVDMGLDKEPTTVQAMQLARRELLARAYQERIAAKATQPSSDEVDRYYDSRPALFAQRRVYTLHEFNIDASPEQASGLPDIARRARSADDVVLLLKEAGLRHRARRVVQAAEDIPGGMLDLLAKLDKGQSLAGPAGAPPRIFTVVDVQNAPVDRQVAAASITTYLVGERRRQLVAPAMKALRDSAKIAYQGSFAKAGAPAAP